MLKFMLRLSEAFNRSLFFGVLGLFVFIPLYPKFPLFNVPGTYVAIRAEDILIAGVVVWWFLAVISSLKELFFQTITRLVLLFWAIGALSVLSGIFLTQTVVPHLGFLHWLRRVEVMMLFFVAMSAFTTIRQIKIFLGVMLFVTTIVVLYGFGQQWFHFPVISTTNREFSKGLILFLTPDARVNATFAGHYDLAAYLAVVLTLASSLILFFTSFFKRMAILLTSFLSFILLTLTAARVSFVAALIGVASVFWLIGQKKLILTLVGVVVFAFLISPELRNRTIATLTVSLLGGGGPKYVMPPQRPDAIGTFSIENAVTSSATSSGVPRDIAPGEPVDTTELGVYRSLAIRLNEEWPRANRAFLKNPLLGTGYSSITLATDNDYLRSFGETGLLGTTALFLVWFLILKKMWLFLQISSKNLVFYLIAGLLSATLVIFANALFIDILESSKIASLLWLSLGVGFAAMKIKPE